MLVRRRCYRMRIEPVVKGYCGCDVWIEGSRSEFGQKWWRRLWVAFAIWVLLPTPNSVVIIIILLPQQSRPLALELAQESHNLGIPHSQVGSWAVYLCFNQPNCPLFGLELRDRYNDHWCRAHCFSLTAIRGNGTWKQ